MLHSGQADWDDEADACGPAVPERSGLRRVVAIASSLALAASFLLTVATPSMAAPGTRVSVDPEVAEVLVGGSVTLTAYVTDELGNPSVGA